MIDINGSEYICWNYPDIYDKKDILTLDIMHTRAINCLKIYFDSTRNGYVFLMDKTKYNGNEGRSETIKEDEEVAFVPAWNEDE